MSSFTGALRGKAVTRSTRNCSASSLNNRWRNGDGGHGSSSCSTESSRTMIVSDGFMSLPVMAPNANV
jgi:hypothetical protein